MKPTSFVRLRRALPHLDAARLAIFTTGALSALLWVALLILAGLIVDLLAHRGAAADDWLPGWSPQPGQEIRDLAGLLLVGLGVAALECMALWGLERAVQRAAQKVTTRLRGDLRRQAFHLGASELFGAREASVVQLFTERMDTVRLDLVAWYRALPREVVRLVLLLALALVLHVWLALTGMLLALLIWRLMAWLNTRARQRQALRADRATQHMAMLVEGLQQVRLVRGYLLPDMPGQPFDDSLARYHRAALEEHQGQRLLDPLVRFLCFAGIGLIAGVAGVNILRVPPQMTLSEAFVLFAALCSAWLPLKQLLLLPEQVRQADRAAAEIFHYLDREPGVGQIPEARFLEPVRQQLELVDVTLLDGTGHKLLDRVSLRIHAGHRVAVTGLDRRAPLALAQLWPRFYDPQHGRVLLDQKDARECTLSSLRSQVALVAQEGLLFTGSVSENISCGDPRFTYQQIIDAAKLAQAYDFVQRLPQGFATIIGEHGMRLAPHQQFRIGLARAVLREPAVMIVEEPEDEVDPQTAELLDRALEDISRRRTLILLPARLSTLRSADQVLLFHEGRLYGEGSHADLLKSSELYRHMLYLRFNTFRDGKKP